MEKWFNIKEYEGYYQISNKARVKGLDRLIPNGKNKTGYRKYKGKILSPSVDKFGYYKVILNKNGVSTSKRIHRLMWETFKGKIPKNKVIDHIDNNPKNNQIKNLQLLSHRDNIIKGTVDKRSKYSKYPNVSYRLDRKKYFGRLQVNGKSIITGHFNNELDAYNSVKNYKIKNKIY